MLTEEYVVYFPNWYWTSYIAANLAGIAKYSRRDYQIAHRAVMTLVRAGILAHVESDRLNVSAFSLTKEGEVLLPACRARYAAGNARKARARVPPPPAPAPELLEKAEKKERPLAIKCPQCSEKIPLASAQELINQGFKVECICYKDLTPLARKLL